MFCPVISDKHFSIINCCYVIYGQFNAIFPMNFHSFGKCKP